MFPSSFSEKSRKSIRRVIFSDTVQEKIFLRKLEANILGNYIQRRLIIAVFPTEIYVYGCSGVLNVTIRLHTGVS